jgi:hypothetical protein
MIPATTALRGRARSTPQVRMWVALLGVALLALSTSCARQRGEIRDASAEAAASVTQRLQGEWVLVGFVPELPLDPALQQLLNVQVERLVARIQGNSVHAEGIGVVVDRTYRVGDVYGDHFKTTIVDPYGVGLDSACDFSGNLLIVNGLDNPWRGRATFRRRL